MSNKSEIIHLRIPTAIKEAIERIAESLNLNPPDVYRLGIGLFVIIWDKFSGTYFLKTLLSKLAEDD